MKKNMRKALFVLSFLIVFGLEIQAVHVVKGSSLPELEAGRTGNLTVCCRIQNEDKTESAIKGFSISIYQVASVSVQNGRAVYKLLEDYSSVKIIFDNMKASESNQASLILSKVQEEMGIPGLSGTTDEKGESSFFNLSPGMYLVKQVGKDNLNREMSPFLIPVPMLDDFGKWDYEVKAYPKTEMPTEAPIVTPTVTPEVTPTVTPEATPTVTPEITPTTAPDPTQPSRPGNPDHTGDSDNNDYRPSPKEHEKNYYTPKTGDDTSILFWVSLLGIAVLGILCICLEWTKRKKKTGKEDVL